MGRLLLMAPSLKHWNCSICSNGGWAMNACHNMDDVPAHRVVNRKGLLTGKHHFDGTNLMQQLLESEGIVVVDNQIVDLEKVYWEPEMSF